MATTIFVTSDQHWQHANALTFTLKDGSLMRPGFSSVEEIDEFMVDAWNAVVTHPTRHHVYQAGDVAIHKSGLEYVGRCRGKLRLVRGNHDIFPTRKYLEHFDEIYGVRVFEKMIISHYPLMSTSVKPGWINVHGHVHKTPHLKYGPRHYNICVEQHGYRPVSVDDIRNDMRRLQEQWSNEHGMSVDEYERNLFAETPYEA